MPESDPPPASSSAPRSRHHRRTARVLLVDNHDRMLLFADTDPAVADFHWWVTPGGGIEVGESEPEAAVRELAEETGLRVDQGQLVGPLARLRSVHGYSDKIVDQDEVFFGLRHPAFAVSTSGHTEHEKQTVNGFRWWTLAELDATEQSIWPAALPRIWRHWLADAAAAPLDLGTREQSSVPVAADGDVRLSAFVSGRVQGVGFRWWTRSQALELGLVGRATNKPDGRVEVTAEGPREQCEELLNRLRSGAAPGRVAHVSERLTAARGDLIGFVER